MNDRRGAQSKDIFPDFASERVLSRKRQTLSNDGKSDLNIRPQYPSKEPQPRTTGNKTLQPRGNDDFHVCPECGSDKNQCNGHRDRKDGTDVQRFSCKKCGYRFSDPNVLKAVRNNSGAVQVCVRERRTKNLTLSAKSRFAGECEELPQDSKGILAQYFAYLEKEGYSNETRYPGHLKRLVKLGANLRDPESVKAVIGRADVKDGAKMQYIAAYDACTRMLKIDWAPPKYKQEETIPFIPYESELDCLISASRNRLLATYLQCLKETYGDPSEVLRLRWIDVSGNIVTINRPVKGHLPRQLEVSNKLVSMLNSLPKTDERIFPLSYPNIFSRYTRLRKRVADLQKNPRLLSVELRSFRHWGGTMIAHYTNGNVLIVKKLLGHKRVENSMKYIGMLNFKDDQFEVTTATTVEEAKKALSAGYDYVTEKNGIMLFRRPKRFSKYT